MYQNSTELVLIGGMKIGNGIREEVKKNEIKQKKGLPRSNSDSELRAKGCD